MRLAIPVLLLPTVLGLTLACGGKGSSSSTTTAPRRTPVAETFNFKPGRANVQFLAVQDGTGPWTVVTPVAGAYSFTLTQGKGAVAMVTVNAAGRPTVNLAYDSTSRIGELASEAREAGPWDQTVNGTVTGVQPGDSVAFALNNAFTPDLPVDAGTWTMDHVAAGPNDLLAVRKGHHGPQQIFIRRGLAIQRPATPGAINLGESGAVDFANSSRTANLIQGHQLTVSGNPEPGWAFTALENLETGKQTKLELAQGTSTMPIYFAPAAIQAPDDRHVFHLQTFLSPIHDKGHERSVKLYRTTPGNVSLAIQPDLPLPVFSTHNPGATPYPLIRIQCQFDEVYQDFRSVLNQPNTAWSVRVGRAYGTGDVTTPDFSALPGWNPAWGLAPGQPVSAQIKATGQTWASGPAPDGAKAYTATRATSFTP